MTDVTETPTRGDAQGWEDRFRPVAADRRAPAAQTQVPVSPPPDGKNLGAGPRLGAEDLTGELKRAVHDYDPNISVDLIDKHLEPAMRRYAAAERKRGREDGLLSVLGMVDELCPNNGGDTS